MADTTHSRITSRRAILGAAVAAPVFLAIGSAAAKGALAPSSDFDVALGAYALPAHTVAALAMKVEIATAEGNTDALRDFARADLARLAALEA